MKKILLIILAFTMSAMLTFAQDTSGKLVGSVSDDNGAVPNATVVVTNKQTGGERTLQANGSGNFDLSLEFGVYSVKITATGYKTTTIDDVKIDLGRDTAVNAKLQVGDIAEVVTVTSTGEQINSTNAELSSTIGTREIRDLPLNTRNPLGLLNLLPGVNATTSSINGQRSSATAFTRDGLNVQDNFIRSGAFVSDQPTVDDTGEFTVTTQNAGVEGGGGTTQVQLVTPRGGKDFHGNLFAFNRNSKFAANSFFGNTSGLPRAFLNRNQYGGSISGSVPFLAFNEGGPVIDKNKLFFFFNYEAFRLAQQAVSGVLTTLLPAAQQGNYTFFDSFTNTTRTVNALSGSGFTGGFLAGQGGAITIDPIIQARIIDLLPDSGNGAFIGSNYQQQLTMLKSDPRTRNSYTTRLDYDVNDLNSLNIIYRFNNDVDARTDQASGFSPTAFVSTTGPTYFMAAAYRTQFNNSFWNEIRGGFQKSGVLFDEGDTVPDDYLIANPIATAPEGTFRTQGRKTLYRNIQNNAGYTWGNHSFRFGAQAEWQETESLNFAGTTPTYTINTTANTAIPQIRAQEVCGTATCINATDLARINQLRNTLGGIVNVATRTANLASAAEGYSFGASTFLLNYETYSGYVSDTWRLRPEMTLNLGLRYDLYTPLNNTQVRYLEPIFPDPNDISTIARTGNVLNFIGTNAGRPGDFFNTDKNNFAPSFGFAYSPKFSEGFMKNLTGGDMVIRGGFRVNYLNDEFLRAPDAFNQANAGLGAVTLSTVNNLVAALTPRSIFAGVPQGALNTIPTLTLPPRNIAVNNTNSLGTAFGVDPNYQVPKVYEWNVGIQRDIGFKTVAEVRYVGNMSNDMIRSYDFNQLDVEKNGFLNDFIRARENCRANGGGVLANCTSAAGPNLTVFPSLIGGGSLTSTTILEFIRRGEVGQLAREYIRLGQRGTVNFQPATDIFATEILTNKGKFRFHAVQAEVRRSFSEGLSMRMNYTFQKTLADVPDDSQLRQSPLQDNNNPGLQFGRPDFDRTHTFNANMIYELPFGKGRQFLNYGGVVDAILGGWQFASIVNLSSGAPLGIVDPRGTRAIATRSTRQSATTSLSKKDLKNLIGYYKTPNGIYAVNPIYLFASATNGSSTIRVDLTQQLPAGYTLTSVRATSPIGSAPFAGQVFFFNGPGETGNMPRNFLNGLPYLNWDASMGKSFRFTETMRLQVRMEAFNVFNKQVPTFNADLNIDSASFGRVTGSYNAPRVIQFGARFDF